MASLPSPDGKGTLGNALPTAGDDAPPEMIERYRAALGLDRSLPEQFFRYAAALATGGYPTRLLAQAAPAAPKLDLGDASSENRELRIVNFETLEEDARKMLHPARMAFIGPAGEGLTYRENRRAFNDFPILPRRLQGVSATAIDMRTKLLEHDLPVPMITCPMGGHGMFHVNAEVATAGGTGMAGSLYVSSGAAHKTLPVHGVQFHPESILTENGRRILQNFLKLRG